MRALLAICMFGCGAESEISQPTSRAPLTAAACPSLPSDLRSRLLIEGIGGQCDLTGEAQSDGQFVTRGECACTPTGSTRTLQVQWFVERGDDIFIMAESVGRADIVKPASSVVEVVFDASKPAFKPKTRALSTETPEENARFDRDGDGCSNLEELCMGTFDDDAENDCGH